MAKKNWQFRSTAEAFNGARIAREAREAGALTLRVERDGRVLEFIYKTLFLRAVQVGLSEIRLLASSTDCIPVLPDGYLATMPLFGSGWRHVVSGTAQELYQKVKAAEARRSVTIVEVITEATSDSAEAP